MQLNGAELNSAVTIVPFEYPSGPDAALKHWEIWDQDGIEEGEILEGEEAEGEASDEEVPEQLSPELEQRLRDETIRSFEAGREHGRQEGRALEREAQGSTVTNLHQQHIEHLAKLTDSFSEARDQYLHIVEHEVVKLALAVAARILRREAQMDPLLLLGAVRVALGQLSASTQVRLRVPPNDAELWSEAIALLPKLSVKPQIVTGENMRLGDCVIETEMGSVDLGVRAQLNEIERGFFDRASAAAAAAPATE